jgi:hypothetical protein
VNQHQEATLGGGVDLLFTVDTGAMEGEEDAVGVVFEERGGDRRRAPGQQRGEGKGAGGPGEAHLKVVRAMSSLGLEGNESPRTLFATQA